MDTDLSLAIVGLLLTAGLLIITWRYAKSTEEIAQETTNAAAAARTTAQVNLLHSLLAVQPVLEVSGPTVEYWHSETPAGPNARIPFRLTWSVTNAGSGIAFNPEFSARIGEINLPLSQSTKQISQLSVGHTLEIAHQSERSTWTKLAEYVANAEESQGEMCFACHDAYGALIELKAKFHLDAKTALLGDVERTYAGGEELKAMLGRLLKVLDE